MILKSLIFSSASSTRIASSSSRLGPVLLATASIERLISDVRVTTLTISNSGNRIEIYSSAAEFHGLAIATMILFPSTQSGENPPLVSTDGSHLSSKSLSQNSATLGKNGMLLTLATAAINSIFVTFAPS